MAQLPQFPRRARADVGETIREQDDTVDLAAAQVSLHLRGAQLDSGIKGGVAARADAGDARLDALPILHHPGAGKLSGAGKTIVKEL